MGPYILRRVANGVAILFAVSIASFYILHAAPGDPVSAFLSQPFRQTPQSVIDSVRHQMGLDQPVYVQYWRWLERFVSGDMGYSFTNHSKVATEIAHALPNTLLLMGVAIGIGLLLGILLGVLSALRPNSFVDSFLSLFASTGYGIPQFWVALMLIYLLTYQLKLLPSSGMSNPYALSLGVGDVLVHLILPATTLAITEVAYWQRYQRDSLLNAMSEDYIRTARAKGAPPLAVVFRHGWRNSLVSIITLLGLSLGRLLTGSYIIETIFSWPGMGHLGIWAVNNRDYPVIMGILMLSSMMTLGGNLLADVGYALADPRIRYGGGGRS